MVEALGKIIVRFRRTIVLVWVVLLITATYFGLKLPNELSGNGFAIQDGRFAQVEEKLDERFNRSGASMLVLFESEDEDAITRSIKEHTTRFERVDGVRRVVGPEENPDALTDGVAYVAVEFDSQESAEEAVKAMRAEIKDGSDVDVSLTGEPVFSSDLNEASKNDLVRAELIGIPVAMLVLLLVFGTPLAALTPLLVGLFTFVFSAGVLYFFAQTFDLSIFVLNAVAMISIALGIDFSLLIVNRFREETGRGQDREVAIARTIETAGRSILFSGLCVFVGLAGLLFVQVDVFRAVALGSLIAVFGAVLAALTLLPALLLLLGVWLDKGRIIKSNEQKSELRWQRLARFVMKRPVVMTIVALLLLLPSLWFVRDLELNIPDADALPMSYESRAALERFDEAFGEKSTNVVLLFERDDMTTPESLEQFEAFVEKVEADELVDYTSTFLSTSALSSDQFSQLSASPEGEALLTKLESFLSVEDDRSDVALVNVSLTVPSSDKKAQQFVRDWREDGYEVGGQAAFNEEIYDEIYSSIPYAVTTVVLATLFILMWAFRSVLIPVKAILMNMLGLGATFGLLVLIFESGYVYDAETISILTPVFIFSLVFGLSMDYEVFLVSRMEEYYRDTGDNDYATEMGLAKTSKIITSAAVIMIVVTGAFAFTGVSPIKQLGVGIALAIFLDATIIRMLLVPSLMKLFGDWNWWWFGKKNIQKRSLH